MPNDLIERMARICFWIGVIFIAFGLCMVFLPDDAVQMPGGITAPNNQAIITQDQSSGTNILR
jgi:hypothetical protein